MKRRAFITLLGGAAVAWPLAARAQQGGKLATIGLLGSGTAAAQSQLTAAFVGRMRELGWIEGRNLTIEYRWAEGHDERLHELASELGKAIILVRIPPFDGYIASFDIAQVVQAPAERCQAIR